MHAKSMWLRCLLIELRRLRSMMKEMYDDGQPLAYYQRGLPYTILHKDSKALLETLLYMLAERVRTQPFIYKKEVLKR